MRAEPYQIEGAEHMFATLDPHRRAPRSCLLLSDPGVGKTVQACTFLNWIDVPAVVCCNAGMRETWGQHLRDWCPGRPAVIVDSEVGARQQAETLIITPGPSVLVMSHENLAASVAGLGSPIRRLLRDRSGVLIVDEAHLCKSATSKRGRGLRDAVHAAHGGGGAAVAMTATPMPRDPIDLWVLLTWMGLASYCFPGELYGFAVEHFGGVEVGPRWRFPPRPPGGTLTGRFAEVALRHRREDVLPGLPTKSHEVRTVPVAGAVAGLLDRAARSVAMAAGVPPDQLDREDAAERAVALEMEIGKRLEDLTELRVAMAEAKIPALLAWVAELEAANTPTAVYSDHLAPVDALVSRPRWVTVRGEDSDRTRGLAVAAFERGSHPDGRPVVGIAFTGAGRVGISLNRAEYLIVVSPSWAHSSEEQAADRILRYGKTIAPKIGHLVLGHPLEVFMHRVLAAKRTRSEIALEGCTRRPARVALPSVSAEMVSTTSEPARKPWFSFKRLSTRRDCGFAEYARYTLRVQRSTPQENRRMGILFAAAIAGRLVVWARSPGAAQGKEGEDAAITEVRKECKENPWRETQGRTEDDGRTAIELSLRAMRRFGFFTDRWEPYQYEGRPAVECELRAPMVPDALPFPDEATRARAIELLSPWAGFYGRADLIAYDREHRGGTNKPRLRLVDFKCKAMAGLSAGLSDGADDLQLMLYLYAARALGIPVELATRIEVVNKLPGPPALLTNKKALSVAQAQVTDVAYFEQAIKDHGFDRAKYKEHLDWLAAEGPRLYALVECGRTSSALEQAWREMLWDASEMTSPRPIRNLRAYKSSPCHSESSLCEVKELCTATLPGIPTPDVYATDLVRLGTLRKTSWRSPKADTIGVDILDQQAPQEQ